MDTGTLIAATVLLALAGVAANVLFGWSRNPLAMLLRLVIWGACFTCMLWLIFGRPFR